MTTLEELAAHDLHYLLDVDERGEIVLPGVSKHSGLGALTLLMAGPAAVQTFNWAISGSIVPAVVAATIGVGLLGVGVFLLGQPVPIHVGPEGVFKRGIGVAVSVPVGSPLTIRGQTGGMVQLWLCSVLLFQEQPAAAEGDGWTFDRVSNLATLLGQQLGLEPVDERIEADWRAWEGSPEVRAARGFAYEREQGDTTARQLPHVTPHTEESLHGMSIELSSGGLLSDGVWLDIGLHYLQLGEHRFALCDIDDVGVFYTRESAKGSSRVQGVLAVLLGRRRVELFRQVAMTNGQIGILNYVAATVHKHIEGADPPPERGSGAEVPAELRQLAALHGRGRNPGSVRS